MTSNAPLPRGHRGSSTAFVWIWLPDANNPVVAGRLDRTDIDEDRLLFTYARSYLENDLAISLYAPELPLQSGPQASVGGKVPGCIEDSGPDSWGRRVILRRLLEAGERDESDLSPLTYFLESASNRIGALDFQSSPTEYVPRGGGHPSLEDLEEAMSRVEKGEPISGELREVLLEGTSPGGARPKATLIDGETQLIAKFSSSSDTMATVKAEFVAMELARRAGINAAPVRIVRANGRDVLLVERFDRLTGGRRRAIVSAATILRVRSPRTPSYTDLVDAMRVGFVDPERSVHELFARIVFNILCGNNDDHSRNHAAFWDGMTLELTPAYDICPQEVDSGTRTQAMAIGRDGYRLSDIEGCVERAGEYLLTTHEAEAIVERQMTAIREDWEDVAALAELTRAERTALLGRQFLNGSGQQQRRD